MVRSLLWAAVNAGFSLLSCLSVSRGAEFSPKSAVWSAGIHGQSPVQGNWDLYALPNGNETWNLIFDSVNSLLQHWPNTRYRNGEFERTFLLVLGPYRTSLGHNIVPGTIPPGTLLYHGSGDGVVPSIPEWTSVDPEHSILFCTLLGPGGKPYPMPGRPPHRRPPPQNASFDGPRGTECWHFTFVATRPLKVLYFDGSSAANMADGPTDVQDLLIWGRLAPEKVFEDAERLDVLCSWGRQFGIDGFVRYV
jgi:hypothetical protein